MMKFVVALSVLLFAGSSSAVAVTEEASANQNLGQLNLLDTVPSILDYRSVSGDVRSTEPNRPDRLTLDIDANFEDTELSLKDALLSRVSPLGFRVSQASYVNVSLERGVMIGVTVPCCGKGL